MRFAIVTGGVGAARLVVALDVLGANHPPEREALKGT